MATPIRRYARHQNTAYAPSRSLVGETSIPKTFNRPAAQLVFLVLSLIIAITVAAVLASGQRRALSSAKPMTPTFETPPENISVFTGTDAQVLESMVATPEPTLSANQNLVSGTGPQVTISVDGVDIPIASRGTTQQNITTSNGAAHVEVFIDGDGKEIRSSVEGTGSSDYSIHTFTSRSDNETAP